MTDERYTAYKRVLSVLAELGEGTDLEYHEAESLRQSAQDLLLIRPGEEAERDKILLGAWVVLSAMVRDGRWRYRAAEQMRRMLESCGPTLTRETMLV